jgi:hypothetical protein
MDTQNNNLIFNWPSNGYDFFALHIYVNNNLIDSIVIEGNQYTVNNLHPGDSAQLTVRGYRNGKILSVISYTELKFVPPSIESKCTTLNSFELNDKNHSLIKISDNLYSGCANISEIQNYLTFFGEDIQDSNIDYSMYTADNSCLHSSGSAESILIDGNKGVPLSGLFNFEGSSAIINFNIKPTTITKTRIRWVPHDERGNYVYIDPSMSRNNTPFTCQIFSDSLFENLLFSQLSKDGFCKFLLEDNIYYYLKIIPNPWHGQFVEYVYSQPLFKYVPEIPKPNLNKINNFSLTMAQYGHIVFDMNTTLKKSDPDTYYKLSVSSFDDSGSLLNSVVFTGLSPQQKYEYTEYIHSNQNIQATLSLFDKASGDLLDERKTQTFIPKPFVRNAKVEFDYHKGINKLSFDHGPIFSDNNLFKVYYSGYMDSEYIEYKMEDIIRDDNYADYHIKVVSTDNQIIFDESRIHSEAITAKLMVTNKSNAYFPNQALFNVANASRGIDNISKIKMYRGPVCDFASGSHDDSRRHMQHMFNIVPSETAFHKDIGIGNLIDYPDKTTSPDTIYHKTYMHRDTLQSIDYYSGQNYQAILIPVNGFGLGVPCKINYELGLNNPANNLQ